MCAWLMELTPVQNRLCALQIITFCVMFNELMEMCRIGNDFKSEQNLFNEAWYG